MSGRHIDNGQVLQGLVRPLNTSTSQSTGFSFLATAGQSKRESRREKEKERGKREGTQEVKVRKGEWRAAEEERVEEREQKNKRNKQI